jgi:hypothetical protein
LEERNAKRTPLAAQQLTAGLCSAPEQSSPDTAPAVLAAVTENQLILAAASEPATLHSTAGRPGIAPASKPAARVPAAAGR